MNVNKNEIVVHALNKLNWPVFEKVFGISAVVFAVVLLSYMLEGQDLFVENPFAGLKIGKDTEIKE